jgi:hypothetical protein
MATSIFLALSAVFPVPTGSELLTRHHKIILATHRPLNQAVELCVLALCLRKNTLLSACTGQVLSSVIDNINSIN